MIGRRAAFAEGIAAVLALSLALIAPAAAQERWTAPSGAFSLDYVSHGMTYGHPLPPELSHLAIVIIPDAAPADDQIRMCAVSEVTYDEGLSRDQIAQAGALIDQARASAVFSGQTVSAVTHTTQNGVTLAHVVATAGDQQHRHTVFYYPAPSGAHFIDIDCFWLPTTPPEGVAQVEAVLNSIQINAVSGAP